MENQQLLEIEKYIKNNYPNLVLKTKNNNSLKISIPSKPVQILPRSLYINPVPLPKSNYWKTEEQLKVEKEEKKREKIREDQRKSTNR